MTGYILHSSLLCSAGSLYEYIVPRTYIVEYYSTQRYSLPFVEKKMHLEKRPWAKKKRYKKCIHKREGEIEGKFKMLMARGREIVNHRPKRRSLIYLDFVVITFY